MAGVIIGRTACPECGFGSAHVRKSEKCLYRYCPECGAPYHAKTERQRADLLAKTRLDEASKPPQPAPEPAPEPAPTPTPTGPADDEPAAVAELAPTPTPTPTGKKPAKREEKPAPTPEEVPKKAPVWRGGFF